MSLLHLFEYAHVSGEVDGCTPVCIAAGECGRASISYDIDDILFCTRPLIDSRLFIACVCDRQFSKYGTKNVRTTSRPTLS